MQVLACALHCKDEFGCSFLYTFSVVMAFQVIVNVIANGMVTVARTKHFHQENMYGNKQNCFPSK